MDNSSTSIWIFVAIFTLLFLVSSMFNIALLKLMSNVLGSNLRHPKFRHLFTSLLLGNLLVTLCGLPAWVTVLVTNNSTLLRDETSENRQISSFGMNTSNIFYYTLDVFHSFLVFVHICVLMFERLYAIGWSIQHRISPDSHDYIISLAMWLVAGILTTVAFLIYYFGDFKELSLIIACMCFPLPILTTSVFFVVILVKKNTNFSTEMRKIEFQMALVVLISMVVCATLHLPLHIIYVLFNSFSTNFTPYHTIVMCLRILQYSSSVFIPIVYMFGIPEFRSEINMFCFKCCSVNESSRNDSFMHMDMPRLDSKCILTNASSSKYTPKEQVELAFTNEVHP